MGISGSFSERFGDGPLAFGMQRFENSDKRALWRFIVSRYVGRDVLIEVDATAADLRAMRHFIDRALAAVETDGGRKATEDKAV